MNLQEKYLFWRLAHYFISVHEYRIVQLSEQHNELWLEKRENKDAQVIRLLSYDLDWSNWMMKDIQHTALNGEIIRKKFMQRELSVLNLYVSAFPPVDDYEFRIEKPYMLSGNEKIKVTSLILERSKYEEGLSKLEGIFHTPISIPNSDAKYTEMETDAMKLAALSEAANHTKKEQALFEFGKPFFTYILMIIQVAMFLFLEWKGGSTNTSNLIQYGAKFNPLILEGEWWRFITPIFLHIGLIHLLMNTLALYYLGITVEKIYGNVRFLFVYLFAGFFGSVASFILSPTLSAGASGAIFGCFGALLYFGVIFPKLFFRTMGMNILIILGINLVFGFSMPSIDNAGHIGGLIGGFLATGIVHFPRRKKPFLQIAICILSGILMFGMLKYGFQNPGKLVDEQSALVMAQEYIHTEEYEKARTLLKEFSLNHTASAEVYFLLSYAEIQRNELNSAIDHLHVAIEKRKDFHEAYYNLALLYMEENNYSEARKYAEKAKELMPYQEDYKKLLQQIQSIE